MLRACWRYLVKLQPSYSSQVEEIASTVRQTLQTASHSSQVLSTFCSLCRKIMVCLVSNSKTAWYRKGLQLCTQRILEDPTSFCYLSLVFSLSTQADSQFVRIFATANRNICYQVPPLWTGENHACTQKREQVRLLHSESHMYMKRMELCNMAKIFFHAGEQLALPQCLSYFSSGFPTTNACNIYDKKCYDVDVLLHTRHKKWQVAYNIMHITM